MARIKIKNSQVKDKAPVPGDLVAGELAINTHADSPAIYLKDTAGAVRKIAGAGAVAAAASETTQGIVELATAAETEAGTDNTRAVHPAGLKATLDSHLTPGASTPPAAPVAGTTYVNTATTPAVINVWNGTAWVPQAGTAVTGGTAPATPAAGQVWVDTSGAAPVTKIWDGTKWVTMTVDTGTQAKIDAQVASVWKRAGTVVSPANAGDQVHTATGKLTVGGTAAAPNLEIKADGGIVANTNGLVYDAANKRLAIGTASPSSLFHVDTVTNATAITVAASTSTGGQLRIGTGGATAGSPSILSTGNGLNIGTTIGSPITFFTDGTANERLRIDSSGRLLVGTSTALTNVLIKGDLASCAATTPQEQFALATNTYNAGLSITNYSASDYGSVLSLNSSNSNTLGTNTLVDTGIAVGLVSFNGNDGTNFVPCAEIKAAVDGTPGANDMPGRLVFSVTPDSKATPEEAMRIKNSKIINFANAPTYADNAAAKAGGLVAGDVYKKADGTLMITF